MNTTTTKLILWIVGTIVIIVLAVVVWFFFFAAKQPSTTGTSAPSGSMQSPVTTPLGGSSATSTATAGSGGATLAIPTAMGTIETKDFINNGVTIPDVANPGSYLLAGDLGYCLTNPPACRAGSTTGFNIFYDRTSQSFGIALLVEPIGETRHAAEQFLLQTLGVTESQLCALNYYVGTTAQVNALYDDRNLGFSFCPGATKLPE